MHFTHWNAKKPHIKKEILYKERDENGGERFTSELNQPPQDADERGVQKEMNPLRGRAKRGFKIPVESGLKKTMLLRAVLRA